MVLKAKIRKTGTRKRTSFKLSYVSRNDETIKLLGTTIKKMTKDKNSEKIPHLEIIDVLLIHCNIVTNDYQHDSRVLSTLVPNKSFSQLFDISPKGFIFLKNF